MALIDDVKSILNDLSAHGWSGLLSAHGLNISSPTLERELAKDLSGTINRNLPGFKDFAREGKCGITAGVPAHSLLYHALASPNVLWDEKGKKLKKFPTLAQIETIENYVYAAAKRSVSDIIHSVDGTHNFAIAVFALEYRTSKKTVHGRHADLCFSRTGVARVGNEDAFYDPEARGFKSHIQGDKESVIRVVPVRYAAYIAVQLKGRQSDFGPARFDVGLEFDRQQSAKSDSDTDFWVPLHKLFEGDECLNDKPISLQFQWEHTNEKLRRIHVENMGKTGFNSGHDEPDISNEPFIFHTGIAEQSKLPEHGQFVLVPIKHHSLVEEVKNAGKIVAFDVPAVARNPWSPTYELSAKGRHRKAPEYVHVRDSVKSNGSIGKLNDQKDVAQLVNNGKYKAAHYIDYTGDGWITAHCVEIGNLIPRNIPAYSIVAACDFFPLVCQAELMDWWRNVVPKAIREDIWGTPPLSLSDQRTAPNLQLKRGIFRAEDVSVTAIISHPLPLNQSIRQITSGEESTEIRNGTLPDAAAGVFAPGWDTSLDRDANNDEHLAAYGLGSPFPEDSKLCAALSTFWPAAAPDSARQYAPAMPLSFATVCPLTDAEIGLGNLLSWDGNKGPVLIKTGTTELVEYTRFEYVDTTEHTRLNDISLAQTALINFNDYTNRILGMNRVFQALRKVDPAFGTKANWGIISFLVVDKTDNDVIAAVNQGFSINSSVPILKFVMFKAKDSIDHPTDFKKVHVSIGLKITCLYNSLPEVQVFAGSSWQSIAVR